MSFAKRILSVCFVGAIACLALADEFDRHVADLFILQAKPVQKDLGITEAQRSRMNQAAEADLKRKAAYGKELEKTKAKPTQAKMIALYRQLKAEVFNQLTDPQLHRLREISLQHDGVVALGDPVVGKRLGLSDAQVKKIQGYVESDAKNLRAMDQQLSKPIAEKYKGLKDTEDNRQNLQRELYTTVAPRLHQQELKDRDQILAVLNSKQRAAWQGLLGRPFQASQK